MKIQLPSNLTGAIQSADYRKLDDGKIWFGEVDKDPRSYPIDTFLDKAMTIPAPPFFWLKMGYVSHNGQVVDAYVADDVERVSILITDVYGRQLMYLPSQSVAVVCDVVPPKDDDNNTGDNDQDNDNGCACEWGTMGILPPVIVQIVPADQPQPTDQPPDDDNGGTGGDIEILPPPPPPPDEFAGFTHTEQRVGFFSTRKFTEENWVDYLKNGTVPTRYNRYDYSIYTDPFILKLTFDEIVDETVKYLSTLLDEGLQKRKYQNPNIELDVSEPTLIIGLPNSQSFYYADKNLKPVGSGYDWENFKTIKPISNDFMNEIDFKIEPTTYYNADTENFWNECVLNNFRPLTIRNRETIGVVGKKVEVGTNAPSEYFKMNSEIPKDGQHTFEVAIFKKCVAIETESDGTRKTYPAGNVTVYAPIYLNMISLIAKRNSEQYFDIFPKNLIENGVNYV